MMMIHDDDDDDDDDDEYLARSTDHTAHRYVVFSTPLFLVRLGLKYLPQRDGEKLGKPLITT
jgi:hypothetical protein